MGGIVVAPAGSFVEQQKILEIAEATMLPVLCELVEPVLFILQFVPELFSVEAYVVELEQVSILHT